MLNPLEVYADAGTKAAKAFNVGDRATVNHWQDWFNQARRMERDEDKEAAIEAFNKAYRKTVNVPFVRGL